LPRGAATQNYGAGNKKVAVEKRHPKRKSEIPGSFCDCGDIRRVTVPERFLLGSARMNTSRTVRGRYILVSLAAAIWVCADGAALANPAPPRNNIRMDAPRNDHAPAGVAADHANGAASQKPKSHERGRSWHRQERGSQEPPVRRVPEPGTLLLVAAGAGLLAARAFRQRKRSD
jgi:hypothetical protein